MKSKKSKKLLKKRRRRIYRDRDVPLFKQLADALEASGAVADIIVHAVLFCAIFTMTSLFVLILHSTTVSIFQPWVNTSLQNSLARLGL